MQYLIDLAGNIELLDRPWIREVFSIVLLTLLANFVSVKLIQHFQRQLTKTKNIWDDILFEALSRPVSYLIWVLGFSWAVDVVNARSSASMLSVVPQVRDVLVIVLIAWFLVRFLKRAENKVLADLHDQSNTDETTVRAVVKLLRMAVMITASLVILQSLGYSIEGVLAFGGVGGIAVGFAAKDLLANFFGGLMVYLDRPFAVGDWIRSPDKDIEGVVEDIGWRLTRIRTFDKRPLYVPNSVFTSIAVENPSRMTNRRIYETVGLRYNDMKQVKDIVAQVRSMLDSHQEIDHEKTLIVNFNAFGDSSLDFFIYTFTKTTDWVWFHEVKQEILLKVMEIIHANGADIAYPTSTVLLPQGALQGDSLS